MEVVEGTRQTLVAVLKGILKLCHPTMPFVSEAIYASLSDEALCISAWPKPFGNHDDKAHLDVAKVISIISEIRNIRSEYNVKPSIPLTIKLSYALDHVYQEMLLKMVKTTIVDELDDELITRSILGGSLALERGQLVDKEAELVRLSKEKEKLENELNRSRNMLANERFMASAPKHKIEDEQNKLMEYQRQYDLVLLELAKLS
jgi:valyl-tRNA synthetase